MTRTDARACRPILPDPTPRSSTHLTDPRRLQDAEAPHLLAYLAAVPDPRAARGRRHPLAAILGLAAAAVLAVPTAGPLAVAVAAVGGSLVPEWRGGFGMNDAQARRVQAWIDGYVRAWNSNDPTDIRAPSLRTRPTPPSRTADRGGPGRDRAPVAGPQGRAWPGPVHLAPLAVTSEVAVIQGEVAYPGEGHTYSNLWVIRLDAEGRCTEFTEWWMRHPLQTRLLFEPPTSRRPPSQTPPW